MLWFPHDKKYAIVVARSSTHAMRIVSLLPTATEMLFALGLGDHIVGVSHECDYPAAARLKPRVVDADIDSARLWSPTGKPVAPAPTPRVGRTSRPAARAGTANGAHGQDSGPTAGWDHAAAPRPSSRAGG